MHSRYPKFTYRAGEREKVYRDVSRRVFESISKRLVVLENSIINFGNTKMADQSHASDARKARASRNQFDDVSIISSYFATSI